MKLESDAKEFIGKVDVAFGRAVEDTLDEAIEFARRHSKSGKFADSLEASPTVETTEGFEARIGSTLSSAKAKEKGAYIQARNKPYLVFNAGDGVRKVKAVRLRPQPAVTPAGKHFPLHMNARLREVLA